jgi:methylated-DNA-[protein]-cysteine S-methyltransferase
MPETILLIRDSVPTPIGELVFLADEQGHLRSVDWTDHEQRMHLILKRQYRKSKLSVEPRANPFGLTDAFAAYFAGDVHRLDTLPVATEGTTFQRNVWQSLRQIPVGETISYGTLAVRLGQPTAVRAVGLANGSNPVSIVVPCHRVIGSNGSLTGYGGGLPRKRWLLDHERQHIYRQS